MTAQPGNIFIISAASGTGKTTLVSRLTARHSDIRLSVSHTTRPMREGEINGQHYHFVDKNRFLDLMGEGVFLEHAEVFGNYYGTSEAAVKELCAQGFDVILEIDVQGATQVRRNLPDAVSIFILPPSLEVLEQRLRSRNTDSNEVIERRLGLAREEISHAVSFDYIVVNHDLDEAEQQLLHIFRADRQSLRRQTPILEKILQNP